jgi:drug/metabolite transporter (DMT)-like permease
MAAPTGSDTPTTPTVADSLVLPPPGDLGLLAIAVVGVCASGPIMAAVAAPALAVAFWRNALGAGVTVIAAVRVRAFAGLDRRSVLLAVAAGACLALHFGTWTPSLRLTSVASATALVCTQAVFTPLIAMLTGARLPRTAWLGVAAAFVGTAMIAGADFAVSLRALGGDGLAVVGGLAGAMYVTIGGRARQTMSAAAYTAICYAVGAVGLVVACLIGRQALAGYSMKAWLLIVTVTVCAQLLGHTLLNVVLRSTSATLLSLALLLEVPGAAAIAAIWLHQYPSVWAVPGLVLLVGGLAVTIRSRAVPGPVLADVD